MDISTYGALPGISAESLTTERAITWGRDSDLLHSNVRIIGSSAVDAGASPTSGLRAGLLLGMRTSDGKLYQFNPDATDGTEVVYGVLLRDLSMLNAEGVAEDKYGHVLLRGPLMEAGLLIEGTAFASAAGRLVARKQLAEKYAELDGELSNRASYLGPPICESPKTSNYTVVEADNGKLFTTTGASGAVTFTLPAIANLAGFTAEFLNTVDQNMTVASAEGDNVVWINDASADSLAASTSSQKIGARLQFMASADGTKWYVRNFSPAGVTITPAT